MEFSEKLDIASGQDEKFKARLRALGFENSWGVRVDAVTQLLKSKCESKL
jgi:hypothetical protein